FACARNDVAPLHPSPICGEGGRPQAGRVGAVRESACFIAPTPASASRWPTLPTKAGSLRNPSFVIHCWWIESGAEDGGSRSVESFGSTGFSKSRAQRDARPLDQRREVVPVREAAFTPQAGGCRPATL